MVWLSARHVGATLVEFIQKLPPDEAEKVHAAAIELNRLKSEDDRHAKRANNIRSWSWIGGVACLATFDAVLSTRIAPRTLLLLDAVIVAVMWWGSSQAIRREQRLAGQTTVGQYRIRETVFRRIGVIYNEADGRVHSVASLVEKQRKIRQEIDYSYAIYDEIEHGALLARRMGLDATLFQHRTHLLNRVLGGLPTEELLEHPDCERLFHEMNKVGLRDHTVEAILSRSIDVGLPISARTMEIAKARMQSVS